MVLVMIHVVLLHTLSVVKGNNFPPVMYRVPIPGLAVNAPLNIPRNEILLQGDVPSSRFIVGPSYGYARTPPGGFSQRGEILEEFERLYESGLPAVGPVATPAPDDKVQSQERTDVDFTIPNKTAVILPPPNVLIGSKSNNFAFRRLVPQTPKDEKPIFPMTNPFNGAVINPATAYRLWPSAPQLVRPLPPQLIKPLPSVTYSLDQGKGTNTSTDNQKGPQLKFMPPIPFKPGLQILPSPKVAPNNIIAGVPTKSTVPQNVIGWVVNPYGQLSQIRTVPISSPILGNNEQPAISVLPVNPKANRILQPTASIENTWIWRQGPNGPYFEQLKSLLPRPVRGDIKTYGPTSSKEGSGQSEESSTDGREREPLVFRRGSEETQFFNNVQVLEPLPHSPKSDVLVIGKGNTIARSAPQKNVLPNPPRRSEENKPCNIPEPKLVPGDILFSRQGQPLRSFQPFSAYVRNPDRNFYILPQSDQWRDSSDDRDIPLPIDPLPFSNFITRNRFTHPFRYSTRLVNYNQQSVFDLQDLKPATVEVIPPPKFDSSKGEDSSSSATSPTPLPAQSSLGVSTEVPDSKETSAEESKILESLEVHASHMKPSVAHPATLEKRNDHTNSFGLGESDQQGIIHHRKETSDIPGIVRGSYGYRDAQGNYRQVEYVAGKEEFKPKLKTVKISDHSSSRESSLEGPHIAQTI